MKPAQQSLPFYKLPQRPFVGSSTASPYTGIPDDCLGDGLSLILRKRHGVSFVLWVRFLDMAGRVILNQFESYRTNFLPGPENFRTVFCVGLSPVQLPAYGAFDNRLMQHL